MTQKLVAMTVFFFRQPRVIATIAVFLIFVGILSTSNAVHERVTDAWDVGSKAIHEKQASVTDVKNMTLGFQRIFAASMPDRTDKRDLLAAAASVTGMQVEFIDGFDGSKANPKAVPDSWNKAESNSTYGCWRAHMNIFQKMVSENIQSVLIMEDDADWDINFKGQLLEFARGSRYVLGQEHEKTSSPYGDGWDLLWLGHCGARNHEDMDTRHWVIENDPTAVPPELWSWFRRQPNMSPPGLNTTKYNRLVYKPVRGLCTYGYAVTIQGARRLLWEQNLGKAQPSDRALNSFCQYQGGVCVAPYPALIGSHKPAGDTAKDSDRVDPSKPGTVRTVGQTLEIVFSTKLNLRELVFGKPGEKTRVKSQWPEKTMLKEAYGMVEIPRGHGIEVKKDSFILPSPPNAKRDLGGSDFENDVE